MPKKMKLYSVRRFLRNKYVIASRKPFGNAVCLCDEGSYPVTYTYFRMDVNGSGVYDSCTCHDRKQLLSLLKWHAKAGHEIASIWTYMFF